MRAIDVYLLQEGQKLAKPVYDGDGRILLHKGTCIKERYIERLEELGIPFVYIEDELVGPLEIDELLHDSVKIQSIIVMRDCLEKAQVNKEINYRKVSCIVNKIMDDILSSPNILVAFMDIRTKNTYFFNHSISVAVLAIVTGLALKLNQFKLKQLGMGAILHDIGKAISTDEDHPKIGYNIIKNSGEVNITVAHVAFQHHERYDGKGFPRNLKGEQIHLYGAITAIANYYDKLISPQDMKNKMYPYQALERLMAQSNKMFHPELVKAFIHNIAPYPIGSLVRLNTGSYGVVISLNANYPTRPIIKLVTDRFGGLLDKFPEIDLLKEKTLFINEIISEKERIELGL